MRGSGCGGIPAQRKLEEGDKFGVCVPARKAMKTSLKSLFSILFTVMIFAGFGATLLLGKAQYTQKEKKACTVCHVKAGSKELNDIGKCYAKDHSLKNCQVPEKK
jgi:hypothetical protein